MQPRALLAAALLALLASARAQEPEEASLLDIMQDYMQPWKALDFKTAKNWMEDGFISLSGYWSSLTNPLIKLWPVVPGPAPGTTPAPAV